MLTVKASGFWPVEASRYWRVNASRFSPVNAYRFLACKSIRVLARKGSLCNHRTINLSLREIMLEGYLPREGVTISQVQINVHGQESLRAAIAC